MARAKRPTATKKRNPRPPAKRRPSVREREDRIDARAAHQALEEMRRRGQAPIPLERTLREAGLA